MPVTANTIHHALKNTIDKIVDVRGGAEEARLDFPKYTEDRPMTDAYHDDLEVAGPGLVSEVDEGEELPIGTVYQGYLKRYTPAKFGQRIIVTEEAIEDNKYPETIAAARRLLRAIYKTADIDASLMLQRAFDSNFPGADGVEMCSNAHPLAAGGTYSNILATPMSPSRSAIIVARTQALLMPAQDGVVEGFDLKRALFPTNQWATWEGLVGSEKAPENDTNEINVVKGLNLELVPVKHWSNTTTHWILQTDAELGMTFRWRRKPNSKTWMTNENELEQFAISARWATGWSNARAMIGSNPA